MDYLFLDGSHFKMHPGAQAEPVLCAWGISTDGKPVFIGLAAASSESTDAWDYFLCDLKAQGLRAPLLVTTDGGPGLLAAMELHLGGSLRQRCVIHRLRNAVAKVSKGDQAEFKADWWGVFDDIDAERGETAAAEAKRRAQSFADKWGGRYPGAVACLTDDLPSLVPHRTPQADPTLQFHRTHLRRNQEEGQSERPAPRRGELTLPGLGSPRPGIPRMARRTPQHQTLRFLGELQRDLHGPPTKEVIDQPEAVTEDA